MPKRIPRQSLALWAGCNLSVCWLYMSNTGAITRPLWEGNLPWGQLLWHWTETSSHQLLFSRQWLRLATDSSGTAGESWEEGHWGGVGGWGVGTSTSWRQLEGAIGRQKTYQKNECAHLPPILCSLHSLCQTQQCGWTCWLGRKDFRVLHVKEGSTDESHLLWHWLNHSFREQLLELRWMPTWAALPLSTSIFATLECFLHHWVLSTLCKHYHTFQECSLTEDVSGHYVVSVIYHFPDWTPSSTSLCSQWDVMCWGRLHRSPPSTFLINRQPLSFSHAKQRFKYQGKI